MTAHPAARHVGPAPDAAADHEQPVQDPLAREVVDALRRYIKEADRLSQVFCDSQGIHRTDLHALLHLRDAARAGEEVGAGQLAERLGLSTGATTAVIDRLERDGHVRRERASDDRRRITVRFGRAVDGVAREFFRPLGTRSGEVLADFSDDELHVVLRFLAGMTEIITEETTELSEQRAPRGRRSPVRAVPDEPRGS